MNQKRIVYFLLSILVLSIFIFSMMQNENFFAYAACRKVAMKVKGYAVWKYQSTTRDGSQSYISFSDGYNTLYCSATGVGPLWLVTDYSHTLVGCGQSLSNPPDPCPEDYFGVEP